MKSILVLNCGSSSIKFALLAANDKRTLLSGLAERLGSPQASLTFKINGEKTQQTIADAHHDTALLAIVDYLKAFPDYEVVGVGHRIVHGGERFRESCLVDEEVLAGLKAVSALAPLHSPANIEGIYAAQKAYPSLPQVVVFDTAFHQTLPETAYLYGLPYEFYENHKIRRYGFHGTSYRYIKTALPSYTDGVLPEKLIVAHLGNGASICAIKEGKSVQTSMGLTPLDGLVQGTRTGSIDPAILLEIMQLTGKTAEQVTDILWKQSGLLGLSGITNDCRELSEKAEAGNPQAARALAVFSARIAETIGAYAATLNGVDALVFTGGIGENAPDVRDFVCQYLGYLGFKLEAAKNEKTFAGKDGNIATADSKPIWVVPTNEEAMICEDTLALINA